MVEYDKSHTARLSERLRFLGVLAHFIRLHILKGNEFLFAITVLLGAIIRIASLFSYALTLQAIVAAIRPDVVHGFLSRALAALPLNLTITVDQVIPVLISAIILIHAMNWVGQYIRIGILEHINKKIAARQSNFADGRTMDEDLFLLEQVPGIIQSLDKVVQIVLLMIMIMLLISLAAPILTLLLLPILVGMVAIQVYGDRRNLREIQKQQDARRLYVNHTDPKDGKFRRRPCPQDTKDRDFYLSILIGRRRHTNVKPETDAFVSAIALSLVIYYLHIAHLSMDQLAGLLVLFVVGLRYMIASGRELSVNILLILNMRKDIELLQNILIADKQAKDI